MKSIQPNPTPHNSWPLWVCGALCLLALSFSGCQSIDMKKGALDHGFFNQTPSEGIYLTDGAGDSKIIQPGPHWMGRASDDDRLAFANWREPNGKQRFCIVVLSNPADDRLVLMPLDADETPLTVLTDPARRKDYEDRLAAIRSDMAGGPVPDRLISVPLTEAVEGKRLGAPVPVPQQLLAVAANFPSHLKQDLAINDPEVISGLRETRPRVFVKYPPVYPLSGMTSTEEVAGIVGPFDPLRYPPKIHVPATDESGQSLQVATHVDYEAEIGIVIGRELTWEDVQDASDRELFQAIVGYLLVSDTKARNPQVVQNIVSRDNSLPSDPGPYLTGDERIDRRIGFWDKETCKWWSYAAGWGDYAGLGPFLIAAPPRGKLPDRKMLAGRSYAPEVMRGQSIPSGHTPDTIYLRQSVIVSTRGGYADRMIWTIPEIIRSTLAPDNALDFQPGPRTLYPGDIISLGTPGGTVITVKSKAVVDFADALFFWWEPMDWHDAFFSGNEAKYLHPGDEVFFWAEDLGYQQHRMTPFDAESP